jgi:DNA-binding CsgD family transcriptional regulator
MGQEPPVAGKGECVMETGRAANPAAMQAALTDKQHQVLGLLLQHKTSKEIARELGISPHTVEQRLRCAKDKLGVTRRGDLATAYMRLPRTCEKPLYEELRIDTHALPLSQRTGPAERLDLIVTGPEGSASLGHGSTGQDVLLVPAVLTGRNGALMRITAVFGIAGGILMVGLGGLAALEQLSQLVTHLPG